MTDATPVFQLENFAVQLQQGRTTLPLVEKINLQVHAGETLAIVGESGCGKSVTMLGALGLLPPTQFRCNGRALLKNIALNNKDQGTTDLCVLSQRELSRLRGSRVSMIFQDPMNALNPTMPIGKQVGEVFRRHKHYSARQAHHATQQLLEQMQIPDAAQRLKQYPFEFSGGMLQRVMIAMALACEPALLVADEPTTALDVTVQGQILELMRELQRTRNMALILITHDLGIVARMADRVAVMYAGQIVEQGSVDDVFYRAAHPYTALLKRALPAVDGSRLIAIDGTPPPATQMPPGCRFAPRCPQCLQICHTQTPPSFGNTTHHAHCWLHDTRSAQSTASLITTLTGGEHA